jgi:hypothetical protein
MFLSKLFKKNQYSNTLQFEDNECSHCNNIPTDKLKKCQDCKCRNICKTCYKHNGKILCKTCDNEYNQWANKIMKESNEVDKQKKYKHYVKDNKSVLLISSTFSSTF